MSLALTLFSSVNTGAQPVIPGAGASGRNSAAAARPVPRSSQWGPAVSVTITAQAREAGEKAKWADLAKRLAASPEAFEKGRAAIEKAVVASVTALTSFDSQRTSEREARSMRQAVRADRVEKLKKLLDAMMREPPSKSKAARLKAIAAELTKIASEMQQDGPSASPVALPGSFDAAQVLDDALRGPTAGASAGATAGSGDAGKAAEGAARMVEYAAQYRMTPQELADAFIERVHTIEATHAERRAVSKAREERIAGAEAEALDGTLEEIRALVNKAKEAQQGTERQLKRT